MGSEQKGWKDITLLYDSTCSICAARLKTGTPALWRPIQKTISCLSHEERDIPKAAPEVTQVSHGSLLEVKEPLNNGIPGRSARKMDEKRRYRKEVEDEAIQEQYRAEHPKTTRVLKNVEKNIPGLIAWLRGQLNSSNGPSSWRKGAEGEESVGRILEEMSERLGFITIHDRLIPGSVANIDHIVVTSSKIFVVDAKKYAGKINFGKLLAPYFGGKATIKIKGRNSNHLLEGVKKQVRIVEQLLAKAGIDIPVQGVLAFVDAKWDMGYMTRPKSINGVLLNSQGLHSIFRNVPPVDPEIVYRIATQLLNDLPPAGK